MSQKTVFGDAEIVTTFELKKPDGRSFYFKVEEGENIAITKEEYTTLNK